jgi:predicted branched-subunit amino acid permease
MLPLWAGAVPSGIAYGVAARAAGLDPGTAQLMSLTVFSATAQLSAVALLEAGAPPAVLIATAMALNAQAPLLGLAIGRQLRLSRTQRLAAALFLTDGVYSITAVKRPLRLSLLLGSGASMYLAWNAGTLLGAVAVLALPDMGPLGGDLVVPLTFVAVLVPLLRTRVAALVAVVAGTVALVLTWLAPGGAAVLGAGVAGCAAGAWCAREQSWSAEEDSADGPGPGSL